MFRGSLVALLHKASSTREAAWAISSEAIAALGLEDCIVYFTRRAGHHAGSQIAAYGPRIEGAKVIEHPITLQIGQGVVGACAPVARSSVSATPGWTRVMSSMTMNACLNWRFH
ncbi:MAG: hypothetical protein IPH50_03645 [Rhodanobacteraceae bacterium]|nr:hypothetical protein [Rhodanobacteraceae bacterium]